MTGISWFFDIFLVDEKRAEEIKEAKEFKELKIDSQITHSLRLLNGVWDDLNRQVKIKIIKGISEIMRDKEKKK